MRLAEKFHRPIIVFVDTPAAYPGIESEERGVAEAIAVNLREMMMLDTPIIVIVSGEGGSGGALGIAIGDRVLMQEFAIYSVIPPEGCAAILWRDSGEEGRGGGGAEAHGARSAEGRASSTRSCPSRSAARTPTPTAAARLVDAVLTRVLERGERPRRETRASSGATRSSATWGGSASISWRGPFANVMPDRSAAGPADAPQRRCDDAAARGGWLAALGVPVPVARLLVPARARRSGGGGALPEPVARSPARSDARSPTWRRPWTG